MEIEEILGLGVQLKCDQALGKNFLLKDLWAQGFRAVFLAIGATAARTFASPDWSWTGCCGASSSC